MSDCVCEKCYRKLRADGGCTHCEAMIDYDAETINGYPVELWFTSSTYSVTQFKINGVTVAFVELYSQKDGQPDPQPYYSVPWGKETPPDDLHGAESYNEDDEIPNLYWLNFDNFPAAKACAEQPI